MMYFSTSKNCPGAATPEQQIVMEGFESPTISNSDDTTHHRSIASLLGYGQENAIPMRHLELLTGLDSRTVRSRIQQERLDGSPILSDTQNGYYLPATQTELEQFSRSMRHRSNEILRVTKAVEKAGANSGGYNGEKK